MSIENGQGTGSCVSYCGKGSRTFEERAVRAERSCNLEKKKGRGGEKEGAAKNSALVTGNVAVKQVNWMERINFKTRGKALRDKMGEGLN